MNEQKDVIGNADRSSRKIRQLLSVLGFIVFLFLLTVDVGDWIVNAADYQSIAGPASLIVIGRQGKVVITLAYFRTQFLFFLAALVMFVVFCRIRRITKLQTFLRDAAVRMNTRETSPKTLQPFRKDIRVRIAVITVTALFCLICFRLSLYIIVTFNGTTSEPFRYFLWTVPAEYFLILQVCMLLAELTVLPVYLWLFTTTVRVVRLIQTYNTRLQAFVKCADSHSHIVGYFSFNDQLHSLCRDELVISGVVNGVDKAFRLLTGSLLLGNALELAAIISQGFMAPHSASAFAGPLDYLLYVAACAGPTIATTAVILFAAAVYDERMRSINLWGIFASAYNEDSKWCQTGESIKLGERLLTVMHVASHRDRGLTVAGTAYVTRPFGASFIMGIIGFVCFLLERSEHYEADQARDFLIAQCYFGNISSRK
ncbi:hypothetical protein BV898_17161 [Hypsibius exemplaris]|uniref:Uncharacterized protein n=1 Tax=Hypsibius exemplaris TaxID=2072580 RepID=A0A9X6RM59_HYPEX|nr:hypothetical protein BV898_17161 [Hypsibius exemplaris]